MNALRVCHIGDVHYCDRHLEEVDRCVAFAIDHVAKHGVDLIVIPGDIFDHRLEQNSPALFAAIAAVARLANEAPLVILQGTLSHDAPHAIDIFNAVRAAHEILVVDKIQQYALSRDGRFRQWTGALLDGDRAVISCLPSVNKGHVAAVVGAENAASAVGDYVADLLMAWAPTHLAARAAGVPTIFMTHGTVSGSVTEHGCPMMGFDHELTVGVAFAAQASAVMVNHIHKAQSWERDGRLIAYPGSLGRLHFGEMDAKGFLVWTIDAQGASAEFIETPARRLVDLEFPGAPDLAEVARIAATLPPGCHVRLRYSLDEEHRASVDREALAGMFPTAAQVKVEGRIAPVQRQRAAGISQAPSLTEQLRAWCALTNTDAAPLVERLEALRSQSIQQITEALA